MSHEVLITRRQSIFNSITNPGRSGRQHPVPASTVFLRPPSAWICKKIKNAFSPGYQDLMGHLILTTSSWSILNWITLLWIVRKDSWKDPEGLYSFCGGIAPKKNLNLQLLRVFARRNSPQRGISLWHHWHSIVYNILPLSLFALIIQL